ncbi:MAG: FtsX-like permease family protein [Chloroflexota bacterium]|nr:FtsX-like permease family protein [Chloroflexota bacterium]
MFTLWRIAIRDVGRNKRRSGLTLIAVALGLALVIVLHGLEMGAMEGSIENNIRVQSGHVQVRAGSYEEDKISLKWENLLEYPQALVAQAQTLAEVQAAAPVLWASGILNTVEESAGVRVYGIDPLAETAATFREDLVGEFLTPDDRSGVLISQRLANNLGLAVGDDVSLLVNTSGEQPDEAIFTIRGLYDTGLPAFDEATIFLPLAKAQTFTRVGERASAVVVLLHDQEDADPVAAALRAPGLELLTWRDLNQLMLQTMESAMGILYMFYLIVLAIVAVVVANTLLMSVFERTREMGILAALGLKGRQIMMMFMLESATLGALGVILGVLLGSLGVYYLATEGIHLGDMAAQVSADIAYGETMYASFQWPATAVLSIVCWAITLLASLYPAWFATRKEPIEALRAF